MHLLSDIMKQIVRFRMAQASAQLVIGEQAMIRSCAVRAQPGGKLSVGDGSIFSGRIFMDRPNVQISIGSRSSFGRSLIVAAESVQIGSDVHVSWGVNIVDSHFHSMEFNHRSQDVKRGMLGQKNWDHIEVRPVKICDKAWIGFGVSILPGVTIGEGAIVGAASVVTKNVEPWTVVAGNPAAIIRKLEACSEHIGGD